MRKRYVMASVIGAAISAAATQAHAGLLGFLSGTKDFTESTVKIDYTADSYSNGDGALVISGTVVGYTPAPGSSAVSLTGSDKGTFSLTAEVTTAGVIKSATATLTGSTNNTTPITEYSSSTISLFGYNSSTLDFSFVEDSTAGALIAPGKLFGIIITAAGSGMPTINFASSFSNHASGNPMGPVSTSGDVFAIPEPASISLLGLGAVSLLARRRIKK
jgi:hypothetical protein